MKKIKHIIRDWLNSEEDRGVRVYDPSLSKSPDKEPVLNFRIFHAENGKILEFVKYDAAQDKRHVSTYIIGKDENLAEKVSKCVSVEMLR